ncbi:hypothetical protein GGI42DRAFT_314088 [Trichoderma sp. SZMC 28013]
MNSVFKTPPRKRLTIVIFASYSHSSPSNSVYMFWHPPSACAIDNFAASRCPGSCGEDSEFTSETKDNVGSGE